MIVTSITPETLKQKVLEIENQIDSASKSIVMLREQKEHLSYLLGNFQNIFSGQTNQQSMAQDLFSKVVYDSTMGTKQLLVKILKSESRSMDWQEIAKIFSEVKKDNVKISTMRVALSQLNTDSKSHVKLIKEGTRYKYRYE